MYGVVAAGAIRLAFRVLKRQNENMFGSLRRPSSQRIPKVTEGHAGEVGESPRGRRDATAAGSR